MDLKDLILGNITLTYKDVFFIQAILFFMFFTLIFFALSKYDLFRGKKQIRVLISFIIGFMAIYYMPVEWIQNYILRYYNLFGFSLVLLIPLILFLFLFHRMNTIPLFRRIFLVFYGFFLYYIDKLGYFNIDKNLLYFYLALILFLIVFDSFFNRLIGRRKFLKE